MNVIKVDFKNRCRIPMSPTEEMMIAEQHRRHVNHFLIEEMTMALQYMDEQGENLANGMFAAFDKENRCVSLIDLGNVQLDESHLSRAVSICEFINDRISQ